MPRLSKAERLANLHADLRAEFNEIWAASRDEREQAIEDRRFYSIVGAQWEDEFGKQFANVPRIEANKIHASVIRIFTEYRNNRISVVFRPGDESTSQTTAETLTGRYRSDRQDSGGQEAEDNAFEEAVGGGMGAFRFRVGYEDDDGEEEADDPANERKRCVRWEAIQDADSNVFFNLDAKRQDKRDATKCFVLSSITKRAYLADPEYSKFSLDGWPKSEEKVIFDWSTPDVIFLAEVYIVESIDEMHQVWRNDLNEDERILTPEEYEDQENTDDLEAMGFRMIRQYRVKRRQIHKYLMNGNEIMEDQGIIPGRYIPVIPVYGKRWYVNNVERFMGHVRLGKDAQRLLNMMLSRLAEIAGVTPYEVPILTPQQVAGHQNTWATGNVDRAAYRLINPITGPNGEPILTPISYVKPPEVPPVIAALTQTASTLLEELMNANRDQSEGLPSNLSERTVSLIQTHDDMQSYIYTDNMAKAEAWAGTVWLSIQRDICPETEHSASVLKPDGTQEFVKMNTVDKVDGRAVSANNPREGKFKVWADVGPSFNSRREATVRNLLEILGVTNPADQQLAAVLVNTILMNMDGEGMEDLRQFVRAKLVRMGAVTPTDEEKEEMAREQQNAQPDPNSAFLLAAADEKKALTQKAVANTAESEAAAELKRAQAAKTAAEVPGVHIDAAMKLQPQQPEPVK